METKKPFGVHGLLARSYLVFFTGLIAGIIANSILVVPISSYLPLGNIGALLIVVGSIFIFWAQGTSRKTHTLRTDTAKENDSSSFKKGPYKIIKYPTHTGLTLLIIGYALIENSLVALGCALLAGLISWLIFIPKQEKLLAQKYGESYLAYKKSMKL